MNEISRYISATNKKKNNERICMVIRDRRTDSEIHVDEFGRLGNKRLPTIASYFYGQIISNVKGRNLKKTGN